MHIRSKRLVSLLSVAAATLVIAAACSNKGGTTTPPENLAGFAQCGTRPLDCNSGTTKPGGTFTWAADQDLATWNTNHAEGGHFWSAQMLSGVIPFAFYAAPDVTAKWNPDLLVEEPKITTPDPQTVVYKIRPEAKWNDGTPISADDFIYQWKAQNEKDCTECPAASTAGYNLIASVAGSDGGKTVTATFQAGKKYPDWQSLFGALYPAHIAKANGGVDTPDGLKASWDYFNKTQITWSGGPYLVNSYTKGQQMILTPNPAWYGKVKPSLEKVIVKIITDQASFIPAMQNNEINAMYPLATLDMVTQAGQLPNVYSFVGHGAIWEHIDCNLENKYLKDKALREAIFKAIDVQAIINRTVGQYDKAAKPLLNHNFLPGGPAYKDVITPTGAGKGDVEAAKQALTTAGYKDVGTALKTPSGEAVAPIRFRHTAGNANRAATAELVQAKLKELGITVNVETTEDLSGTLDSGDYDCIVFAWVGTPFVYAGAEQIWGKGSASNFGNWVNDEADTLLKQAVTELDATKAADLLNRADELMAKDYYVLPLFQRATFIAVSSQFANVRDNPTSSGPFYNLQDWGLRATAQ
jgi:peptide/nickel transport system substrate-binding protein